MKKRIRFVSGIFVLIIALSLVTLGSANAVDMNDMHGMMGGMKDMHGMTADMDMHHMHIMMSHGLSMVTEGSNLVMLADMKMAPSLDQLTMEHGRHMMGDGKEMIEQMMRGPEMKNLHMAGHGSDPLMKYTHELGNALLEYVNIAEDMGMKREMSDDMMTMHHMHILINHALDMAAEGSILVMLGRMDMAKGVDKESVEHGEMMISGGSKLLSEVMGGSAMKAMHERGVKMNNDMMAYTHKLGAAAQKVVDLLSGMPK